MNLIRLLLLAGFLFSAVLVNGQTDFRPGYVIDLNNDTIFGEIDYRGDVLMSEICRFRKNSKENEIRYSPTDILAYRFIDSKYFVAKEITGKKVFLEFLINGQINIYYRKSYMGDHYYLEKEDAQLIEIPYEEGVKHQYDMVYLHKSTKHIGILSYYMKDAPDLQSKINTISKPEHKNLIKLAEDYHNLVCKDEACIIYEKQMPALKMNLELIGGGVRYQNVGFIENTFHFQSGILTHIWMPRTSEKLYLRTGFLFTVLEYDGETRAVVKFPFQFEYIYPRGRVRPVMAYGVNLYRPVYQSVAFMGGLNIKLTEMSYLGLYFDADFMPFTHIPLLPKKLLTHSILAGFIIKF
jgi:hypothetical protein